MNKKIRRMLDIFLLLIIIAWIVFLYIEGPEQVIETIGVHNGYLIVFFASLIGGIATVSIITVYPTIIAFAIGGLNPYILGIIAATSLTIANLIYFYLGAKSRSIANLHSRFDKICSIILRWMNKRPEWLIPILIWAYVGLSPFSNNLLTTSGGLIEYPIKKIIIPLFVGNVTFMIILAYFVILFK